MFGHLPEFFIVLVVGLIVFGPERLPEVAATVGKMVREVRQTLDMTMNPRDVEVPTDFSTYYNESLARAGEPEPDDELHSDYQWDAEVEEPVVHVEPPVGSHPVPPTIKDEPGV